jgi:peptidoglycan/LPS O-acetylase OafA/YrhL
MMSVGSGGIATLARSDVAVTIPQTINSLTGLRGVAAVWVVSLHYTLGIGWREPGFWFDVAAHGSGGVIVFFVLSGWIMAHVYHREFSHGLAAPAYFRFLGLRFARIYPLHLFALLAWVGIVWAGYLPVRPQDNDYTFWLNIFLVQAWGFTETMSWNDASWSISIEAFAYLLFPFALFWLYRAPVMVCAAVLAICLYFLAFGHYDRLLAARALVPTGPFSFGAYLEHFWWMFLGGVALYRVSTWFQCRAVPQVAFDIAAAIGIAIILYSCTFPMRDWIIAAGAGLIILGLASDAGLGRLVFGNRVVFFLGEISYALYLTHMMSRMVLVDHFPRVSVGAAALFAIAFAAIVYYALEKPARFGLRKLIKIMAS